MLLVEINLEMVSLTVNFGTYLSGYVGGYIWWHSILKFRTNIQLL